MRAHHLPDLDEAKTPEMIAAVREALHEAAVTVAGYANPDSTASGRRRQRGSRRQPGQALEKKAQGGATRPHM